MSEYCSGQRGEDCKCRLTREEFNKANPGMPLLQLFTFICPAPGCSHPYGNHPPTTATASAAKPTLRPVHRAPKSGDPLDRLYPIFRCTLINSETGETSEDSEALIKTGDLPCDVLLPAHDAIKLGLRVDTTVERQLASDSTVTEQVSNLLTLAPAVKVEFRLKAADAAEDAPVHIKRAMLIAAVMEEEYKAYTEANPEDLFQSPPSGRHTIRINVSPIKHLTGTAKGRVILGESGMHRLELSYHGATREISLMEEPMEESMEETLKK